MTANDTAQGEGWRHLQARVFVLIGVGVLGPLVALGAASWISLSHLSQRLGEERELVAAMVAGKVDDVLRANLELLQGVAAAPRVDPADGDPASEYAALRSAFSNAHLMRAMFVVGVDGRVVAQEPLREPIDASNVRLDAAVRRAALDGRPTVTDLVIDGDRLGLYLLVPIHDYRGQVTGLVVGEVDPHAAGFAGVLRTRGARSPERLDLVDALGDVLATTEAGRQFSRSEAAPLVADVLRGRTASDDDRAGAAATSIGGRVLAPLSRAPWAIVMHDADNGSLAAVTEFRRRMLLLVPLLVGLGALIAWGAARSVTRPVVLLTLAAERIGAGELSDPIPPLGRDEVGRLGQALDAMRVGLKRSLDEIEEVNSLLERRVDERTRELAHLNRELQAREQWRGQLLTRVIVAQEDERKRIARELHDETSQTLSVLAMRLETAVASIPEGRVRERLADAKTLTVRALDELHRLIFDLRPSILDDLGLLPAIRWYAERTLAPLGITTRCECPDPERRLPPEMAIALFRVVQEAISNVARHSKAETVLIQCALTDGDVIIEIEDDGCGFEPAAVSVSDDTARGLGLLGMRERVELVGGRLTIDSAPGRGAHVTVCVPMPKDGAHG
jgi:signal transduction histidine kinase